MDKQKNVRRDVTNSCADSMLNRITECFKDSLKGIPQIKSAVIDSINEDGSINIFFPPNETKLFTRISNQSPFILSPGDGVEIMLKNGSFDNCWIIAKHGVTRADMNTQQNKTSNDTLKNTISNIDPSQVVGVTKTSQLINDSKFISQDEPIINSPDLRGMPTAPKASKGDSSSQIANTSFVFEAIQDILEESKVLTFEGTLGIDGIIQELPDEHAQGDVYIISSSGLYAGHNCNVGDLIICIKDGLSKNDEDWYIVRTDLSDYIKGPSASIDKHIAVFDGITGKIIKDSGYTIEKSVPSNAVFTDTVYTHPKHEKHNIGFYKIETDELGHVVSVEQVTKQDIVNLGIPSEDTDTHYTCQNVVSSTNTGISNSTTTLSNGEVYLNTVENNTVTSSHKIIGQGNIKVTTDKNGNIIISYVESTT